jgi:Zn-finger nucleic acid-binding protein/translation elongation factor EF-1beta
VKCPTCGEAMTAIEAEHVEVDMCTNCGGVWLDDNEFEALLGTMECPMCNRLMHMREMRGVEYDVCSHCGSIWLDRGELGTLVEREPKDLGRRSHLSRFLDETNLARNLVLAKTTNIGELDTSDPVIDEIFLIHTSGILVAHATRRLKPDQDDTILSAMLVAIQGFVQESWKDETDTTLKEIAFGNRRILLERGNYMLLAVVVADDDTLGTEDIERTRGEMNEVVLVVESQYKDVLEEWDGFVERFRGARDIISRIFQ